MDRIRESLLTGTYEAKPVGRVETPKGVPQGVISPLLANLFFIMLLIGG